MGLAHLCDHDLGCTFVVWDRTVTFDHWRDHIWGLSHDRTFPPGIKALADLTTAAGDASITIEVIEEMSVALRAHSGRTPPIELAVIPNHAWDRTNQVEYRDEGTKVTAVVFNDLPEACAWLDIDAGTAQRILNQLRADLANDKSIET